MPPRRIGILTPSQRQQPFVEFADGCWRIWIAYNPTVTSGTYLELSSTGLVERVTINNNDVLEVTRL